MTRIIAGGAASLSLTVPGSGTRPTSDRVREALFSALEARDLLDGARVADVYAGSGALGLEALSRGAESVVLVEKASSAAAICRRNGEAVRRSIGATAGTVLVEARAALAWAEALGTGIRFDLVFIDPPYELGEAELSRLLELLAPHLETDALLVVERARRSPEPSWPAGVSLDRRRDYGDTTLWLADAAPTDGD